MEADARIDWACIQCCTFGSYLMKMETKDKLGDVMKTPIKCDCGSTSVKKYQLRFRKDGVDPGKVNDE